MRRIAILVAAFSLLATFATPATAGGGRTQVCSSDAYGNQHCYYTCRWGTTACD